MMTIIEQLQQIADDVVGVRRDWDVRQVMNVLYGLRDRKIEALADAAMRAATDTGSSTPTAITFAKHWEPKGPTPITASSGGTPDPLPECAACGQPARREVSARLQTCPSCGKPWVPYVHRPGVRRGDPITFAEWYARHHDDPDPEIRAGAELLARMFASQAPEEDPWAHYA